VFYAFQAHVGCLLDTKIKTVQSDWGGEYHRLHSYFSALASLIVSLARIPHSRTGWRSASTVIWWKRVLVFLLILIPLRFWDEAFLTACYLINRMPTAVLQQDTPIYRLLQVKPDYSFLRQI
jgi:histone deacetylase 1/2